MRQDTEQTLIKFPDEALVVEASSIKSGKDIDDIIKGYDLHDIESFTTIFIEENSARNTTEDYADALAAFWMDNELPEDIPASYFNWFITHCSDSTCNRLYRMVEAA